MHQRVDQKAEKMVAWMVALLEERLALILAAWKVVHLAEQSAVLKAAHLA